MGYKEADSAHEVQFSDAPLEYIAARSWEIAYALQDRFDELAASDRRFARGVFDRGPSTISWRDHQRLVALYRATFGERA